MNKYHFLSWNNIRWVNVREYRRGNQTTDNPEKLETQGSQDTRWRQTKQKHSTVWIGHHYAQENTNNGNQTNALLQTTGSKNESNIVLCENHNGHHNAELRTQRHIMKIWIRL